ncbi:hypothetical protein DMB65_08230 [Flavobacterium cheongpyeongense]|uniref:Uncharacterized protein n=1 Tax=Flavobacterium cheongpyeongense TaxID=2212651 RepID=A0A2V4BQS8_9FLAO|nr:hypothetical protein [Flavobacterium cheongpyeongense]PXY41379.1 hypothetical protein DMB65_08230 [Flavobacterium cheongpyeongense]
MKAKIILKWIIGIYFLLVALGSIIQQNFIGLILIPFGLFIIPSTYQFLIEEKANLKLTAKTKWIVAIIGLLILGKTIVKNELSKNEASNSIEQIFKINDNNTENIQTQEESKILNFIQVDTNPTSEPRLSGEFMSKLNLNEFKIFTVRVKNKNGLEPEEKEKTFEVLAYKTIEGYKENRGITIEYEHDYGFRDSSGYCVDKVIFHNNIYEVEPECNYQILSSRRFIYENEKENIPFQLVYPQRLLRLCK